ncbi:MAG: SatD family protein [Candidatus Wukongarchaeota archaeon]|nr:SatD family protein [Candidatus Wukongarchaeota archaeon]MDO8128010.1 SatD family protein [Candidatus Wukongarchaeota archaeon]
MHLACVITVDIKGSKKLKNRAEVQNKILNLLSSLNKEFNSFLIADFMMTLGDEFQGVLKTTSVILNIYKYVKKNLPVGFYCGVGIGYIETSLSEKPSEMDGSAFHHSRGALKEAKKRNIELVFKSHSGEIDFLLNSVMRLILHVKSKWTKKQRERISFLESEENIKLSDVAKKFQVSKQAISKMIRTAGWRAVRNAEKLVENYLKRLEQSKPNSVYRVKTTMEG